MLKRTLPLILTLAISLASASCIFDPSEPPVTPPPTTSRQYYDLSQKWHVLNNIELSYNKRNIDKYNALMDEGFTFFLSAGDVGSGLPESWGRVDEYNANKTLFSTEQPTNGAPRCKSIKMDIQWEKDPNAEKLQPKTDLFTIELPNSGPNQDETWYTTTVFYDFQIDVEPDLTYINNPGSKAQFTVRNAGTVDAPIWKLVEFRDLGGN